MGCGCGNSNNNSRLAKINKSIMGKKKTLYRIKKDSLFTIDSYFRFRGGDKIYVKGITQEQLANLYRNGMTDIEIVEETKSKDDNKKETSK